MTGDVTSAVTMLEVQGQQVLVFKNGQIERTMTFVHHVDFDRHELRLVNRAAKDRHPDYPVKQGFFNAIRPARPNKAGVPWEVVVK